VAKGSEKKLRERLLEVLQADDDEDDDADEDVITLRGPSARKLLGLIDDDKPSKGDKPDKPDEDGDDPDPKPEAHPQRTHSRYFGDK
jgi:hypothetical protein